jgi:hypothetical protein
MWTHDSLLGSHSCWWLSFLYILGGYLELTSTTVIFVYFGGVLRTKESLLGHHIHIEDCYFCWSWEGCELMMAHLATTSVSMIVILGDTWTHAHLAITSTLTTVIFCLSWGALRTYDCPLGCIDDGHFIYIWSNLDSLSVSTGHSARDCNPLSIVRHSNTNLSDNNPSLHL